MRKVVIRVVGKCARRRSYYVSRLYLFHIFFYIMIHGTAWTTVYYTAPPYCEWPFDSTSIWMDRLNQRAMHIGVRAGVYYNISSFFCKFIDAKIFNICL